MFFISKGLSEQKRSLPFSWWPSSAGRQVLASVQSESYQIELYFFKLWSVVIASTTPECWGGKQEGRPAAVLFLPFHAPRLVDIQGCKHRLHGRFQKKNNPPTPLPNQPYKKKATTESNFSKSVQANYSNSVPNCCKPYSEQARLRGEGPVVSVSVSQLFPWLTLHNCMLL